MATRTPKKVRLAIFDIDGTIFRSSLIIELFNELVRRGVFPAHASSEVERSYIAWLNRKGHYNDYLMKLVGVFYRHLAGCSIRSVSPAVRAAIAWQKNRVHRYPRQLMQDLREKGYFILALSNSPEPMVKQFAKAMHFDAAIGHVLQVVDGTYTGRSIVDGQVMPGYAFIDKVAILNRFIKEHGLNVDLKRSVMIGDSEGDTALLSYVGGPIAFNPSLKLANLAQEKGWQIVIERKDAVYSIRSADLIHVAGQEPKIEYGKGRIRK